MVNYFISKYMRTLNKHCVVFTIMQDRVGHALMFNEQSYTYLFYNIHNSYAYLLSCIQISYLLNRFLIVNNAVILFSRSYYFSCNCSFLGSNIRSFFYHRFVLIINIGAGTIQFIKKYFCLISANTDSIRQAKERSYP